jgi:hypothetical protein
MRNNIFFHVLGGYDIQLIPVDQCRNPKVVLDIRHADAVSTPATDTFHTCLNLTLVCRQIYTETAMLPFTHNTFVFSHPESCEKRLAQMMLPAQHNAITVVKCPVKCLFFEYKYGSIATRHCVPTFRHLEGLKRLVLVIGSRALSEEEKECAVVKIREANDKEGVEIVWTAEAGIDELRDAL